MSLSKRLNACVTYTSGFNKLADIGTDHAFLPITAVQNGYVFEALAIDNKEGPYVIAYSNIKRANLEDKIKPILGDGLAAITDDVDVVVISGMGGKLISNILIKDPLKNVKRLILQPNSDAHYIRAILPFIGFYIIDELFISEGKKYYEVIVLEKGNKVYDPLEIKYGPILLKDKPFFFQNKIFKDIEYYSKVLPNISNLEKIKSIESKLKELNEVKLWMESK
ncbi:hypothetical protein CI105_03225 [Candidatus Izimaplasma bacterium ZiA1]|uniref:tRNA (adenine(22)-N(1))-methyltransferase n=1 Tax=Candidatus Izimoplasma sp. ZiA1 TaxID=2024899 RepID=UPI000BAA7244|nr:hypothetical protein CI105_03225 [Candidatus Izimaplasma bacterium ZiA1]